MTPRAASAGGYSSPGPSTYAASRSARCASATAAGQGAADPRRRSPTVPPPAPGETPLKATARPLPPRPCAARPGGCAGAACSAWMCARRRSTVSRLPRAASMAFLSILTKQKFSISGTADTQPLLQGVSLGPNRRRQQRLVAPARRPSRHGRTSPTGCLSARSNWPLQSDSALAEVHSRSTPSSRVNPSDLTRAGLPAMRPEAPPVRWGWRSWLHRRTPPSWGTFRSHGAEQDQKSKSPHGPRSVYRSRRTATAQFIRCRGKRGRPRGAVRPKRGVFLDVAGNCLTQMKWCFRARPCRRFHPRTLIASVQSVRYQSVKGRPLFRCF